MDQPGKGPGTESDQPLFRTMRRRRHPGGPPWRVLGGVLVVLLLGAGAWYGYRLWSTDEPAAASTLFEAADTTDVGPGSTRPQDETPIELPALDSSDEIVRQMVGRLSTHPRLASWLVPDELVRRFVVSVVNIATGGSPAEQLEAMAPSGPFQVRPSGDHLVIDPASFERYDPIVSAFTSLDAGAGARLYRQLHPLFEEAYGEMGMPGTFDETMATAMGNLLAVEIPEAPLEVEPYESVYVYGDAELESLTPAQKHLLRFGPENARQMQAKLRQLAVAIGLDPLP